MDRSRRSGRAFPQHPEAKATIRDNFNPLGLLPLDRRYWSYPGSITVPPCTEGVQWLAMQNPTELAQDQLQAFARLYPDNARPLQSTHGRKNREGRANKADPIAVF